MKGVMRMIKRPDLAFILGRMGGSMKGSGPRGSSMGVASLFRERKGGRGFGRRGRGLNGSRIALMKGEHEIFQFFLYLNMYLFLKLKIQFCILLL